jgi:hypothetical protein
MDDRLPLFYTLFVVVWLAGRQNAAFVVIEREACHAGRPVKPILLALRLPSRVIIVHPTFKGMKDEE